MITKEQALTAREFHTNDCAKHIGPKGGVRITQEIWRRNGKTQTWVTRPAEFRIPVKHGLYEYGAITHTTAPYFHTAEDCPLNAKPDDVLTLRDALLGGPGLDGYIFNASTYCVACGQAMTRSIFTAYPDGIPYPEAQDSETVPQPIFFGESDTAEHCDDCGAYLYGATNEEETAQ